MQAPQQGEQEIITYKPKPGFQTDACRSNADFVLTGGQAGPGKTWWICLDAVFDCSGEKPLRMIDFPKYKGVLFRRQQKQTDVLLAEATPLYNSFGGEWRGQPHNNFTFPSGAKIYISHMNAPEDWTAWKGYELHFMGFDELTEFLEAQVLGILPWLRSTVMGVRPRFAATTNPEGDGLDWVERWWDIKCPCKSVYGKQGEVLYKGHDGINKPFYKETKLADGRKFRKLWHFIPGERSQSHLVEMERKRGVEGEYEASLVAECGGDINSPRYLALGRGCWKVTRTAFFGAFSEKIHVIPDDLEFSDSLWAWASVGGHDHATSEQGDACAAVLLSVNQNRDVVVDAELYGWGWDVERQKQEFNSLFSGVPLLYSGDDIFKANQGGETRTIEAQFRNEGESGITFDFLKYKEDIPTTASLIFSALMATIKGSGGALFIRARCKRLIADLGSLAVDKARLDRWNPKQRTTVGGKTYHFDIFRAFCAGFCGAYSTDELPLQGKPMSKTRKTNIEEAETKKAKHETVCSCQYSL